MMLERVLSMSLLIYLFLLHLKWSFIYQKINKRHYFLFLRFVLDKAGITKIIEYISVEKKLFRVNNKNSRTTTTNAALVSLLLNN